MTDWSCESEEPIVHPDALLGEVGAATPYESVERWTCGPKRGLRSQGD